jgi:nicotinamidase-related amidase
MTVPIHSAALLIVDPQRDFCSPDGTYARHGVDISPMQRLIPPLAELIRACQQVGVSVIATQFTILTDRGGVPLVGERLLAARPFLREEGFRSGTSGHGVVDSLPVPDFLIEKPTFSAFYATRLDFLLTRLGVTRLLICGVGSNGAVETTLRDAQLRDYDMILVTDCTAGFRADLHELSMKNMATLAGQLDSKAVIASLQRGEPDS